MSGVAVVWAPEKRAALELIAKAKEMGLDAVVASVADATKPEEYVAHGAKAVHVVDDPKAKDHQGGPVTDALAAVVQESGAKLVLISGGRRGKEVAPRLGAKLKAAVVTLAVGAKQDGGRWTFERMFLGGKTVATEVPATDVVIATIPARSAEPLPADPSRKGDIKKVAAQLRDPRVKVLGKKPRPESGVNLEAAQVVVGAGRGFKTKDDLKLAFDLAQTLGGQVGCSRPLATDLGWLSDDYWIGLSGKEVKPKAYIAAGISGQIQHTTGIRGSKVIVAINSNKDAPIFKMADYGIVGDLYRVLPALDAAIKQQKGR
ncbi:MAG TPA: electron transfer flavoprotein subunit alpha/FixB family protein [Candidatus Thermoplasmatota archaeon]|nr:electron transfer flavoprotein subunit alpha/FixB family protein [Candidatus Thermoplasmatota archaeon]